MKPILPSIDKDKLISELTPEKFLRHTNFEANEIYIFTQHDSPNLMLEVGRLRELAFRSAGGGTGESIDIDEFDSGENSYKQLIVWSPVEKEIIGGYRYIDCSLPNIVKDGQVHLATTHLFHFTERFQKEYLSKTIELGRSFVQPSHQSKSSSRKTLFALDNLWDGLGALCVDNPHIHYFFGKVTMYTHYNQLARDYILYFQRKHFADAENLVYPHNPLKLTTSDEELQKVFTGENYQEDYKVLSQKVRELHEAIPSLVNAYMNLSPTMRTYGTAINDEFGGVEETGILITIADIYESKKHRHVATYKPVVK